MNRNEYVETLLPPDPILQQVEQSILQAGLPSMSVRPMLGRTLTILVEASRVEQALEIGTYGGYSAICIARGLSPGGHLTSLEMRPEHAALALDNLSRASVAHQVSVVEGTALDSLQQLVDDKATFDFLFIDADKPNYPAYLDFAVRLVRPGGLIVADNVLFRDKVIDSANLNPAPAALRQFNHALMAHPSIVGAILPMYDGFSLGLVKANSGRT